MAKTRKIKKKYITIAIIIAALLVLILASVYTVLIRPGLQETRIVYEATQVERGKLDVTVNESGSISYAQSSIVYELNLNLSDDDDDDDDDEETTVKYLVVEEVYKAAGERVNEGDKLLKFDQASIESVRRLLAASVADEQVDYNDAKSEYELNCLSAELDYKTQLINAGYAKKIYNDSKSGVSDNISSIKAEITQRESQVADLEEAVAEAQEAYDEAYAEYAKAKEQMDSMDTSNQTNYLSYQRTYQQKQNAYTNAQSALDRAKQSLSSNNEQITKLKKQLSSAQTSKDIDSISIEQEYQESLQSGDNAYLVYRATLESLEETLKEAEDDLNEAIEQQKAFEELVGEDGIVTAPGEGLLVSVNVSEGDEMTNQKTMISYVTADALTITVDVTEEDIVTLSVGDTVDIELVAYPDEHFEGIIKSIDTTATSSDTNTVSYHIVISIEGDLSRMYGGMTANIAFKTAGNDDTLYISRKALVEQNGSFYVYVKTGLGEYELQKVTIGLKNTSYVEILSGLNENDTIYIATTGA